MRCTTLSAPLWHALLSTTLVTSLSRNTNRAQSSSVCFGGAGDLADTCGSDCLRVKAPTAALTIAAIVSLS